MFLYLSIGVPPREVVYLKTPNGQNQQDDHRDQKIKLYFRLQTGMEIDNKGDVSPHLMSTCGPLNKMTLLSKIIHFEGVG